jgi:hypothetical protein
MECLADNTQRDQAVNAYLAAYYGENPPVTYLDINSVFILERRAQHGNLLVTPASAARQSVASGYGRSDESWRKPSNLHPPS